MHAKRLSAAAALLVTALVLCCAGCSGPGPAGGEEANTPVDPGLTEYLPDAPPEPGDWLVMWMEAEMPHLNPVTSTDGYSITMVLPYVFDQLLDRDPDTLELIPSLAESWEASPDHLVYTFHLREGVVFSDGVPLTAEDVKFTFDRIMDPAVDAPHLRNYVQDITSVEVLDPRTVRFTCAKPYFMHPVVIGLTFIIPKHIYGVGDFNNHPANRAPVGSGMYVLEQWTTGQEVVLARNPRYWGTPLNGRPHVDKIRYAIITDRNAAFQLLARGDLDVMAPIPAEDWTRRANTPRFREKFNRFATNLPTYNYIGWNLRKPQFSDQRVRRALAMLMDRQTILTRIYEGLGTLINAGFMPGMREFNDAIPPVPFDPAGAAALLAEAGWKDTDNDAVLDKDGVPLRFETLLTNQSPSAEKILTVYKEELARVGVDLVIRPMEWASMLDRVDKREFDSVIMRWQMTPDPDPYQLWHSSQADKGSNHAGFVNAEADKLIEDARTTFDREERIRMYHRFQEILSEEQPYLFMLAPKNLMAAHKRIQGIRNHPFGMEEREWFVPKALQRYGQ